MRTTSWWASGLLAVAMVGLTAPASVAQLFKIHPPVDPPITHAVPDPATVHNLTGVVVSIFATNDHHRGTWMDIQAGGKIAFATGSNHGNYQPLSVTFIDSNGRQRHAKIGSGDWGFVMTRINGLLLVDLDKARRIQHEEQTQAGGVAFPVGGLFPPPPAMPAVEVRYWIDPWSGLIIEGRFANGLPAGERPVGEAQLWRDTASRPFWVAPPAFNLPPVPVQ
jgi:hypothetical protein